ncbi:MAG: hypothetical protein HC811_10970 [Flammeovirgaceae bacterium]|nr:hypothetical protein [Flammeovirgaceae bacterium]
MSHKIQQIDQKLTAFNKKYYTNLLIRGVLLTLSLVLGYYVLATLIEYNLWLSRPFRLILFTLFFAVVVFSFLRFLREPFRWWIYGRGLNQEDSAKLIGKYFPFVGDRLLNLIQLAKADQTSDLIDASLLQRSRQFEPISFESAINLSENKKYLRYLAIPFVLLLLLFFINQNIFTSSTPRIIQFNREFAPLAPFTFEIQNENLFAFFNEDYTLSVKLTGKAIPDAAYIVYGTQRHKMEIVQAGMFVHTFNNLQNEVSFKIEAAGFFSELKTIKIINRPELINLKTLLNYPAYLEKRNDELVNTGNLLVPEGTKITWKIATTNAKKAEIKIGTSDVNQMQLSDNQLYTYSQAISDPNPYLLLLANDHSENKDRIQYFINVIKDQYPQINVEHLRDSILFKTIHLGGTLVDDYGVTGLKLHFEIQHQNNKSQEKTIEIPVHRFQPQQNFFFTWPIDSLHLQPGDRLTYYLQVWDNDGVNGRKSTKSSVYVFSLPGKDELSEIIKNSQSTTQSQIDKSVQRAKELNKSIEEAQQKLKGKQVLDWQDRKMLEDLLQQKNNLDQLINELQKQNELLDEKKENLSEQSDEAKAKAEQLQKLLDELLDEETKRLFEELEKLLNEKSDLSQIQRMLEQMQRNENTLEKELERTMELFKQLQYEYKLEQAIESLNNQIEKQEELLEKTEQLVNPDEKKIDKQSDKGEGANQDNKKPDNQDLAADQEELQRSLSNLINPLTN